MCLAFAGCLPNFSLAQASPRLPGIIPGNASLQPPLPGPAGSPVAFFRQLLAMTPAERVAALTNRPPEARTRIVAKIHEYLALDPDERELRLSATELRWWLAPLFKLTPDVRAARVALVPDDFRPIVESRLAQWDALPPDLQTEFLENDKTLHYFSRIETTNQYAVTPEQQKIAAQFDQFFDLTDAEKKAALNTLSAAERTAMEKTLASFEQLPPQQRMVCVHNYAKFAGMSLPERRDFLKNAEKWAAMSPKERQSWRDLVARVPIMPPMPIVMPPVPIIMPHSAPPKLPRASVATN
ncbi:MAG TPA: DUF3106 domain-containing protein [Candidatus Sulfotelmatobacter sp.]|nr:DUF3106 domain-containing protein [Candidatus Sulfotelmatobacter sp.]